VLAGALAGAAIAALDLGLIGRYFPLIDALAFLPQLADHVAFGAVAGLVIARRRGLRPR
jgi:branched-subunit amino acid ABC-type transport system permease component